MEFFKNIFKKKDEAQTQNNGGVILHFKDGIKAHRFEVYRDIAIIYLEVQPINNADPLLVKYKYHFFYKNVIEFDEANDLEVLRTLAVQKIDNLL